MLTNNELEQDDGDHDDITIRKPGKPILQCNLATSCKI